jgi:periplasmic mercuric ion binding protein
MFANLKRSALACWILGTSTLLVVGCTPTAAPIPQAAIDTAPISTTTVTADGETVELVSLRVPTMHCVYGCLPKIKKELEQHAGVAEVTLAQQASEEELDNPVLHIRIDGQFDADSAIAALAKIGFAGAAVER